MSSPTPEALCQAFIASNNPTDQRQREEASKFILSFLESNCKQFFILVCQILLNPTLPNELTCYSLLYFQKACNICGKSFFQEAQFLQERVNIKQRLLSLLGSPDLSIRNLTSNAIASACAADRGNFHPEFSTLIEMIINDTVNPAIRCSALQSVFQIFERNIFDFSLEYFSKPIDALITFLVNILMNQSVPLDFIILALQTIELSFPYSTNINFIEEQFYTPLFNGIRFIIQNSGNVNLTQAAMNVVTSYLKYFLESPRDGELINFPLILDTFAFAFSNPNPSLTAPAIHSLSEFVKYEHEIHLFNSRDTKSALLCSQHHITNYNSCKKPLFSKSIQFAEHFSPILIQQMTRIDPSDVSVEDVDDDEKLHREAYTCLRRLSFFNSQAILSAIDAFWKENGVSDNWVIQHTLILTAGIVIGTRMSQWFQDKIQFIIAMCGSPNDRLSEISFYILSLIMNSSKAILSQTWPMAMEKICQSVNRHAEITSRALTVASAIVRGVDVPTVAQLFGPILEVAKAVFKRSELCTSSLLESITKLLSLIGEKLPLECGNLSVQILTLVEGTIQNTIQIQTENIFSLQSRLLDVISSVYIGIGAGLAEHAPTTMNLVFGLLAKQNTSIAENAMIALINIISAVGSNAEGMIPTILQAVSAALQSQSPELIINTVGVLKVLFKAVDMSSNIQPTIQAVIQLTQRTDFMPDFVPRISNELSFILFESSEQIAHEEGLRDSLLQHYIGLESILKNSKDEDLINTVYEATFNGFSVILKIWPNFMFLRKALKMMSAVIYNFSKHNTFLPELDIAFCNFIENAISLDIKRLNLLIVTEQNKKVLIGIIASSIDKRPDIASRADEVLRALSRQ